MMVLKAYLFGCMGAMAVIGAVYYVVQNDRQMKQRKRTRADEKHALQLLQQIKRDQEAIRKDLDSIDSIRDSKKREYMLAQCNELLLRLLERLDAIRPREAIVQEHDQATAFEEERMQHIKKRKRQIIQSIQRDFDRVDQCKQVLP
ncbi:hypothetical protein BJV82DRAFT_596472 [Fennellomyces sp. T-0311]|nr:hypothetical protein BJV82DRAFT_596472 [Fennellomyces sp. T-0311]